MDGMSAGSSDCATDIQTVRRALSHPEASYEWHPEALAALDRIEAVVKAARFFAMPGVVVHPDEWRRRAQRLSDALVNLDTDVHYA